MRGVRQLGHQHAFDDLACLQCGGIGAAHEIGQLHLPAAAATDDRQPRAERGEDGEPVGRRIGVRQAAAHGAAIAHRAVGDAARHRRHHPALAERVTLILDRRMGDGRADEGRIAAVFDAAQLGDAGEIDQQRGRCQPQIEHGPERLAARDRPRILAAARQRGERVAQARRCEILERGRFHSAASDVRGLVGFAVSAARMRRGVAGVSPSSTPMPASASLSALTIAAGGAIALPSPTPFKPNSV